MSEESVTDALWPAIVGLGFGLEAYGLVRRKPGLTLSSHVWEARDSGRTAVRKTIIGSIFLWLSMHFLFGGSDK